MDYNQAKKTLIGLPDANEGDLSAMLVDADLELSANRELVSAAAHEIATEPDVIADKQINARQWFPYSFITRSN